MEGGTLSSKEFAEWGKGAVLFCHITTRVESDKHQDLLSKKGGGGFPYIIVMGHDGAVLAKHNAERSVGGFDATLQSAKATSKTIADLMAKVAAGDAAAKNELFRMRLMLGHMSLEQAKAALKELTLNDADKATFAGLLLDLEVTEVLNGIVSEETQAAAGKHFAAMLTEGRVPADPDSGGPYWQLILVHADGASDAALFERALGELKTMYGKKDDPRLRGFFEQNEKRLAELKAKKTG